MLGTPSGFCADWLPASWGDVGKDGENVMSLFAEFLDHDGRMVNKWKYHFPVYEWPPEALSARRPRVGRATIRKWRSKSGTCFARPWRQTEGSAAFHHSHARFEPPRSRPRGVVPAQPGPGARDGAGMLRYKVILGSGFHPFYAP
jgi:hypothetical protein